MGCRSRARFQRTKIAQPDGERQRFRYPAGGVIAVGMGRVQANATSDEPCENATLGPCFDDRRHPTKEQRVVNDEKVGVELNGFGRRRLGCFDGQKHAPNGLRRIATDPPDGVPIGRRRGWVANF